MFDCGSAVRCYTLIRKLIFIMETFSLFNWWHTRAIKTNVITMLVLHIPALLAFVPYFFSFSGLMIFLLLYWVSGGLGITLCYHRLLTHKSFKTYTWLRRALTFCGCLSLQGSPITWVGTHRAHHMFSDKEGDPHSPKDGFSWAHMLWVLSNAPTDIDLKKYTRDLAKDPFMLWIERYWWMPQVIVVLLLLILGFVLGGLQLAISWFVWGVALRTVVVYHVTWFVNSAAHTWGYRNYDTKDNSRNLWWVALFSFGEGWHNNHHAQDRSAAHGQRWFEVDLTYWTICILEVLGLATDVVRPKRGHVP
jgi:fatty-acid desaturase